MWSDSRLTDSGGSGALECRGRRCNYCKSEQRCLAAPGGRVDVLLGLETKDKDKAPESRTVKSVFGIQI